MRRRLLDLCLLAYPSVRRGRDHDYLRDLALELAETYGLWRQAVSLLRGGLSERVERRRLSGGASRGIWMRRAVIGCFVAMAMAFAASGLSGIAAGGVERVEVDRLACVDEGHSRSKRDRHVDAPGGCARTAKRLVATRLRGGWDCAMQRHTRDGQRAIAWRCTL
jgi:hypothetical protein